MSLPFISISKSSLYVTKKKKEKRKGKSPTKSLRVASLPQSLGPVLGPCRMYLSPCPYKSLAVQKPSAWASAAKGVKSQLRFGWGRLRFDLRVHFIDQVAVLLGRLRALELQTVVPNTSSASASFPEVFPEQSLTGVDRVTYVGVSKSFSMLNGSTINLTARTFS